MARAGVNRPEDESHTGLDQLSARNAAALSRLRAAARPAVATCPRASDQNASALSRLRADAVPSVLSRGVWSQTSLSNAQALARLLPRSGQ
jgi:hypothetical protein